MSVKGRPAWSTVEYGTARNERGRSSSGLSVIPEDFELDLKRGNKMELKDLPLFVKPLVVRERALLGPLPRHVILSKSIVIGNLFEVVN